MRSIPPGPSLALEVGLRRVRGLAIEGGRCVFAERRDCNDLASALGVVANELQTRARLPVGTPVC